MLSSSSAIHIIDTASDIYEKNGFESASGYVVIMLFTCIIFGMFFYLRKQEKINEKNKEIERENQKEERKQYKDLMDTMISSFLDTNKKMIEEIKTISNKQSELIVNFNSTIESIYNLNELGNNKMIETVNAEKELSLDDFEKITKIIIENGIFGIQNDLSSRIYRNDLILLKGQICGCDENDYENSEIYSIVKNNMNIGRSKIHLLKYNNPILREKLNKIHIEMALKTCKEIIKAFDVKEGYSKDVLNRIIKNIIYKLINDIKEINYKEL